MHYIGMDYHKSYSYIVVEDKEGKRNEGQYQEPRKGNQGHGR
jgi:hypothetical protein